jgi:hypothetical protein
MVFASAAARTTALSGVLAEGMISYLKDTDAVEKYNGSAWIAMQPGDIEGVTATSPLTGGGTSGTVTIGIQDGTTAQKGAVQLTDSISSTSTTTAATPNSVKTTYDLAVTNSGLNLNSEKSFLGQINQGPIAGENLMRQAAFWIDALQSTASGQTVTNLGWAGTALNAQAGSSGSADSNDPRYLSWTGDNYLYLPGVAGNNATTPDAAALDITGDIDLRVKVALDDWTPSAEAILVSKSLSTGNQRGYFLYLYADGKLGLTWSSDGTATITSISSVATGITDGTVKWVRATLDVDNGAAGNDVSFFLSDDGTTWTQLGTTVTTAGTTAIYANTSVLSVGASTTGATPARGKFFRARVLNGIDGTIVLDSDFTTIDNGNATSFTANTGQTITINSSTSGNKSVIVTNPVWLLGTDDYFEVPDNSYLDFSGTEDFSLIAVMRSKATAGTNDAIIAKKANTTNTTQGWALTNGSSTALAPDFQVGDGAAGATASGGSRTNGALTVLAAVRNITSDNLTVYVNGSAGSPVTDATTTTSANSEVLRIGRLSGAGTEYSDMELMAAAVFRRVLTATEVTTITNYYSARYGS